MRPMVLTKATSFLRWCSKVYAKWSCWQERAAPAGSQEHRSCRTRWLRAGTTVHFWVFLHLTLLLLADGRKWTHTFHYSYAQEYTRINIIDKTDKPCKYELDSKTKVLRCKYQDFSDINSCPSAEFRSLRPSRAQGHESLALVLEIRWVHKKDPEEQSTSKSPAESLPPVGSWIRRTSLGLVLCL